MKPFICHLIPWLLLVFTPPALGQGQKPLPEENFYAKSLHFTARGIDYLYSKEQGGIGRITGISASELGCSKSTCHVSSCDACHAREVDGRLSYTTDAVHLQEACQRCHGVVKDDPDVHIRKGMKCMDCHSAREIHGDGVAYNSYMQPERSTPDARNATPTLANL